MAWTDIVRDVFRGLIPRPVAAPEGEPRPGPYLVNNPDGVLPHEWGQYANYWQMGRDPIPFGGTSPIVEACVDAYSQTIAMCPGDHWWTDPDTGGRERVTTSALSRILRKPNEYQSRSDFMLNLARDLYSDGNTYAWAQRNDRYEVAAFHPFNPKTSHPVIGEDGSVFYRLNGNNILDRLLASNVQRTKDGFVVPARDVLHVKLEPKPNEPLVGEMPLKNAEIAVAAQNAIGAQLIDLFGNMMQPFGVIETEKTLTETQLTGLREKFRQAWSGIANRSAGPPVLTNGFKFNPISVTGKDAELSAVMKLTQDQICMVYGVPPAILGMTDRGTFSSTEALMQFWLARSLGFAINHIEVALDQFFGLPGWPTEYVELDTRALLRVAYKERMEALARGVQTGIYTPNEARRSEDLPDKKGGDEPRVQQQQVPLDWGGFDIQPPAPQAPAAPDPEPEPKPEPGEDEDEEAARNFEAVFEKGISDVIDRQAA
jgi:HK97 family phage portal protein